MRRLAAAITTLALAALVSALAAGGSAQGSSSARFDVIFDDARGLVGGQLVKIAGASAGTIDNVIVTPDFKARVEASIDSRFMPFHQNATCTIRPEGLIAENYVDCDPGTADSPPLRGSGGAPPTVPVTRTTEPVSLLDLFNMFNLPARERFSAIVDELGIGTSARGQDFNAILRRANPALTLAQHTIAILVRQRAQLAAIIDATGAIAAQGASHTAAVRDFLDAAASLTAQTAAHRGNLALAVNRLPRLLAAAQPTLAELDTVARDGTPLVAQVHAAVPALTRVQRDLGPFVAVARPALAQLASTLAVATPAIRHTTPLISTVRSYGDKSLPGTLLFARLATNLQQHGFVENFLSVVYYISSALSRFDATSHMLATLLVGAHNGLCSVYATTPVPGCSANYGQSPAFHAQNDSGASAKPAVRARGRTRPPSRAPQTTTATTTTAAPTPAGTSAAPSPGATVTTPAPQPQPPSSGPVQQATQALQNLVNYLLK